MLEVRTWGAIIYPNRWQHTQQVDTQSAQHIVSAIHTHTHPHYMQPTSKHGGWGARLCGRVKSVDCKANPLYTIVLHHVVCRNYDTGRQTTHRDTHNTHTHTQSAPFRFVSQTESETHTAI